jgi:hypothetical protein
MSKRFLMERFLGLSPEEILKNEKMWREERDTPELETTQGQDLRAVGVTPGALDTDIAMGDELAGLEPADAAQAAALGTDMPGGAPAAPGSPAAGTVPPPAV